MRFGVVADIHANIVALEAALGTLERTGIDRLLCAGDVVGYGPFPNECVERLAQLDALVVAGNHDLAATGALSPLGFESLARDSLEWTRAELNETSRAYLSQLPTTGTVDRIVVCHGTLDDPNAYVWTKDEAQAQIEALKVHRPEARILVSGHTHSAALFRDGWRRIKNLRAEGVFRLEGVARTLLNPGSVGQSREPRPWARCALVDTDADEARFFTAEYDVEAVRTELARRGRPPGSCHLPPSRLRRTRELLSRALGRA